MTWIEIIAFVFVSLGLVAGAFLVAQRPAFWIEFATRVFMAMLPFILKVLRRMTPEEEAAWREAERRGQGDEWLRKRRGAPPKG